MDACLLTAHTRLDWGGLGSAGGCCFRWGPEEDFKFFLRGKYECEKPGIHV